MSQHNTNPAFAGGGILIEAAELHIVSLPLITPFVISNQTLTDKTFPLLVLKGEAKRFPTIRGSKTSRRKAIAAGIVSSR